MQRNIQRMQNQANRQGVRLRPHVKTTKCEQVVAAQMKAGAQGITVSTLKEAQAFFAQGITDILYAVAMAPTKLYQAMELRRAGCSLAIVTDSVAGARAIADFCRTHGEALIASLGCEAAKKSSVSSPGWQRLKSNTSVLPWLISGRYIRSSVSTVAFGSSLTSPVGYSSTTPFTNLTLSGIEHTRADACINQLFVDRPLPHSLSSISYFPSSM